MDLPESGKRDSNVLQLENIRNKHKKSTRTTKSRARSRKGDENHILTAAFEKHADSPAEVDQITVLSKPDLFEEDVNAEVIKTPAKRSLVSNRRFDKAKVERIKAELADESYEIDYLRVADKFIEHERFG
ncbi:MAG: anti-sigma28 factor (negative regulator of flagellin synthesis) [Granulosicoccus sp.]|jgi:anti-sigma28 factor (negative regulator of flagellin synthesis)